MTKADQEDEIVRLMLSGRWQGMKSRAELAKRWQCHERTVGDRAMVASGVIERLGGDVQAAVREALAELDNIKAMALEYTTTDGELQPKLREAIDSIRLKMDIMGVTSKSRGQKAGQREDDSEYDRLPLAEKKRRLQVALDDLSAQEAAEKEGLQ